MKKQKLELTWIGKMERPRLEPRILLEDKGKSYHAARRVSDKDIFDNILIKGDNLLALRALEQEFTGKVKCVYIDPPYNTGSAFAHYDDGIEHSLWLSLIRDRLEILRKLLSEDGSIWISIDDTESHYLKVLCDEIFGRFNFIANVIWQKKYAPANDSKWLSDSHDHILVFAKNKEVWRPNKLARSDEANATYKNPDNDSRGVWASDNYTCNKNADERPNLYYSVINPNTGEEIYPSRTAVWRYSKERHLENEKTGLVWWGKNGTNSTPRYKRFLSQIDSGVVAQTILTWQEVGHDAAQALEIVRNLYPNVTDFERDFPSLCFALATGVGKTRLMGAFVAYLNQAKGVKHFFVLAPNLTIYNKLISDFSPESAKYVLRGIKAFSNEPPEIITGDNYESGRGVRAADLFGETAVHINIFNISKINSEVRGGKAPRIKRLSEYIGESYFNYLAGLDDLVLLMDESHRYRGSAGINAINELKPILGLELTATPQIENGQRSVPFKNVVYGYPLSQALTDGFVKEPTVATRENFKPQDYSPEQLEKIKLEDGVRIHESTKVDLETFTKQNDLPHVKPFMLVVARDTEHAGDLVRKIRADDFFGGSYKDKVITVHSNQRGEESDETIAKLLAIENPKEATEIVVHVNMLKEGWDVTNLYTIVPLRAANSRTLVEQSIGRGLRLPFGKRVNYKPADRLTIVAHDKFSEIVDEANRPDSALKIVPVYIGRDVAVEAKKAVTVEPNIVSALFGNNAPDISADDNQFVRTGENISASHAAPQPKFVFENPADREIARATFDVIRRYERLKNSAELKTPEIQAAIVKEVKAALPVQIQASFEEIAEKPNVEKIVETVTEKFVEMTIDIPKIIVEPTGESVWNYQNFRLDTSNINLQPVSQNILLQSLQTNERERLADRDGIQTELVLENYIVADLINYEDISYDADADLLYDLSGQVIAHLRSYLPDEAAVKNVLQYHRKRLAELVRAQMLANQTQNATDYEAKVTKGFITLRNSNYSIERSESARSFRAPVEGKQNIRSMHFGGFAKCLYPLQKFDSDSERRFSIVLEDDPEVLKWFKPARGHFQIFHHRDESYEPDFVVETGKEKFLCEVKRADAVESDTVESKAAAARKWCEYATAYELESGGKAWRYVLIAHDSIFQNLTFDGLVAAAR